jgi:hypothetical protein
VYADGGEEVGTLEHVVAAPAKDIFHGIVMLAGGESRFVAADQIASLHERGVDLRIDAAAAAELPAPHGGAPAWRANEPGLEPTPWQHLLDLIVGRDPRRRSWSEQD